MDASTALSFKAGKGLRDGLWEPRDCSDEEKAWIVQESFGPGTTVEDVAGHVGSVSIEARRITVRLDGEVSTVRITAIASAFRAIR